MPKHLTRISQAARLAFGRPGPVPAMAAGCMAIAFACAAPAQAAGGHFTVDDAALLAPGECQLELWHATPPGSRVVHAGPSCRVGAVELGLNVDRMRFAGSATATLAGAQVKWVHALGGSVAAGIVVDAIWQDAMPRGAGAGVLLPLTWQAADSLLLHLNAGRVLRRGQPDNRRAGVGLEWTLSGNWSLQAERFHEERSGFWRAGLRWQLAPQWNVDLSRARGTGHAWWTLGLTVVWQ